MTGRLTLPLDRARKTPISEQIQHGIGSAIKDGTLRPGEKLPSWRDLAAQLGVARGTVRAAYERLADAQLIVASRSAGTRVAALPVPVGVVAAPAEKAPPPGELTPALFQMGIPAPDLFPRKLLYRFRRHAANSEAARAAAYPDPCGELELRRQIAAYLAIARGVTCGLSQIFITNGYMGALAFVLRVLGMDGREAWMEEPGFPVARRALEMARMRARPIPVDAEGINVAFGAEHAGDAALALVTPGQQAPLGCTLSLARRTQLLEWAARTGAWIIEDDYLSELQLGGRAAPALASLDHAGRVIHIGSFSKTISPVLRLGYMVVPPLLVPQFSDAVLCMRPAPDPTVQLATAEFIRDGHYLRHLRRAKRVYTLRRDKLKSVFESLGWPACNTGLAVLLKLPPGYPDGAVAREARAHGMAPTSLSNWYASSQAAQAGLLLGVATAEGHGVPEACRKLIALIGKQGSRQQFSPDF
jgi:GntR family transcriptional regulator/MocR family aminotransferase